MLHQQAMYGECFIMCFCTWGKHRSVAHLNQAEWRLLPNPPKSKL